MSILSVLELYLQAIGMKEIVVVRARIDIEFPNIARNIGNLYSMCRFQKYKVHICNCRLPFCMDYVTVILQRNSLV